MGIGFRVRKLLERYGFTLKRLEMPISEPIDVLELLVDKLVDQGQTPQVVEIGANDGHTNDPIGRLVRRLSLPALVVEPLPTAFASLTAHYSDCPNVRCENCAISDADGAVALYRVRASPDLPPYTNQLASFDRRVIEKQRRVVPNISRHIESIEVPGLTLSSLLRKHGIQRVDILQVDTEGFDYAILRMLWKTPIRPTVINFEVEHMSAADRVSCARDLQREGYQALIIGWDVLAYRPQPAPQFAPPAGVLRPPVARNSPP